MSVLVDKDIREALRRDDLIIIPFSEHALGTNSYDVHLARRLLTYKPVYELVKRPMMDEYYGGPPSQMKEVAPLDCKVERDVVEHIIGPEGFVLKPGTLYLGVTREFTVTKKHLPYLEGKSSIGRYGLSIHVTAGKGDIGFRGHWTMEMHVIEPLRVYAGMPIGQLIYHEATGTPDVDYASKPSQKYSDATYSEDPRPVPSRMFKNFVDGQPLNAKE